MPAPARVLPPTRLHGCPSRFEPSRGPQPIPRVRIVPDGSGVGASVELGRRPWRLEPGCELLAESLGGQSHLLERVAIAKSHCAVIHRLAVDGHSPRGADLVLAAIALADRP